MKSFLLSALGIFTFAAAFTFSVSVLAEAPPAPGKSGLVGADGTKKTGTETMTMNEGDGVQFLNLKDGQTIPKNYVVKFGVKGKELKAAADSKPTDTHVGHHHMVIDGGPMAAGTVIPTDATHLHFGKAQTETTLQLPKGDHKLTLQFGDAAHYSYGPEWSSTVNVHVK